MVSRLVSISVILLTLATVLLNNPDMPIKPVSARTPPYVHIGDQVPIVASGLLSNTIYQVNFGTISSQVYQGIRFTSTATGTAPAGLVFTIPDTFGGYVFPPTSTANARAITISSLGNTTPIVTLIQVIVVPSYTLNISTGPVGTNVTIEGTAFPSGSGLPHPLQVVYGGDPTQTNGTTLLNPGLPVALIPTKSIPASGDFTTTFIVPNVLTGVYDVWTWEDANGNGVQEVGELATLPADIQRFTSDRAPLSVGGSVASIYSSATGLGFEETGNGLDNTGAGFMIGHRSESKVVFTFTDSTRVNQGTGQLRFTDYGSATVVAGPLANPTTAFYETGGFTALTITLSGGNAVFKQGGTTVYTVSLASLNNGTNDYFVMETFQDGAHTVVVLYGINAAGTLASGVYFDTNFSNFNAASYPADAYIIHWVGTTPKVPLPTDTYTIVFHT